MYAIVKTGGLQYKVQPGDTVTVNKLDGEIGSEVMLTEVLMVVDPQKDTITVGRLLSAVQVYPPRSPRKRKATKLSSSVPDVARVSVRRTVTVSC